MMYELCCRTWAMSLAYQVSVATTHRSQCCTTCAAPNSCLNETPEVNNMIASIYDTFCMHF